MINIDLIKQWKSMIFNASITTKIVCRPNCPPGRRTKEKNRVYFQSLKSAYRNGYRNCKVCKPSVGLSGPWTPKNKS